MLVIKSTNIDKNCTKDKNDIWMGGTTFLITLVSLVLLLTSIDTEKRGKNDVEMFGIMVEHNSSAQCAL